MIASLAQVVLADARVVNVNIHSLPNLFRRGLLFLVMIEKGGEPTFSNQWAIFSLMLTS